MAKKDQVKQEAESEETLQLTDKQKLFCDYYLANCNATQAARDAGYSENCAKEIGYENLTKPHIRAYIDTKLKAMSLTAEETLKSISDIARSSLNEYFNIDRVTNRPWIEVSIQEAIACIEQEIDDAEKFMLRAGVNDEDTIKRHNNEQIQRKHQIIRLQIEQERNPSATKIIPGPEQLTEVANLDLVKLVKDREAGRIKSFIMTENGPKVEMYAADAALTNLAKIHGLFEKDNDQKKPIIPTSLSVQVVSPKADDE